MLFGLTKSIEKKLIKLAHKKTKGRLFPVRGFSELKYGITYNKTKHMWMLWYNDKDDSTHIVTLEV